MSKLFQYLKSPTLQALESLTSEAMQDGWQPKGGAVWNASDLVWVQAMTRAPQPEGVQLREPKR